MNIQRTKALKLVLPVMLGLMVSGSILAKPHDGDRCDHKYGKLERLIKHLDLNDDQQVKADAILSELKQNKVKKQVHKKAHFMLSLNPEESGYLDKINTHAESVAENVKTKILEMAKAKQALYAILDEEQKQTLAKKNERRLKKLEKRMNN